MILFFLSAKIFTGSPRSFGSDTAAFGMMYNNMQHPSGTATDYYGRTQGKGDESYQTKFININLPSSL